MMLMIDESHPSKNYNSRVMHLIMHYTVLDFEASLQILTEGAVSAHYLIARGDDNNNSNDNNDLQDNQRNLVYRLVPDLERAWHAGVSNWRQRNNVNDTSIGIEFVNPGFTEADGAATGQPHWHPYCGQQIAQGIALAQALVKQYNIAPSMVLGHSDVAIGRKMDPGIGFPWKRFHDAGVGAWPDSAAVAHYQAQFASGKTYTVDSIATQLLRYGYVFDPAHEFTQALRAFQMHFRPTKYDGVPDPETVAILHALIDQYMPV
jgi:N-acetyl-anhydromuramyl-L-alanine amidase AmpD